LAVGLLTMYVMGRIWSNVFWGQPEDAEVVEWMESDSSRLPRLMTSATAAVVVMSLLLMVFAGPLYSYAERTAAELLHPQVYVEAVLGGGS